MLSFLLRRHHDYPEPYENASRLRLLASGLAVSIPVHLRIRPPASRTKVFFIFAQGRTGSRLLETLLNSHPEVHCGGEIFRVPILMPYSYVPKLAARQDKKIKRFGFRVKPYQLLGKQGIDPRVFLRRATELEWQCIHLRRDNHLRHAISNIFAAASSKYHFRKGERRSDITLTISPDDLLERTRRRARWREVEPRFLDGIPHKAISYEEDLITPSRQAETLAGLFSYLGVPALPASTDLRVSVGGDLRRVIENYDEVEKAVLASEFRDQLYDPRYST